MIAKMTMMSVIERRVLWTEDVQREAQRGCVRKRQRVHKTSRKADHRLTPFIV